MFNSRGIPRAAGAYGGAIARDAPGREYIQKNREYNSKWTVRVINKISKIEEKSREWYIKYPRVVGDYINMRKTTFDFSFDS